MGVAAAAAAFAPAFAAAFFPAPLAEPGVLAPPEDFCCFLALLLGVPALAAPLLAELPRFTMGTTSLLLFPKLFAPGGALLSTSSCKRKDVGGLDCFRWSWGSVDDAGVGKCWFFVARAAPSERRRLAAREVSSTSRFAVAALSTNPDDLSSSSSPCSCFPPDPAALAADYDEDDDWTPAPKAPPRLPHSILETVASEPCIVVDLLCAASPFSRLPQHTLPPHRGHTAAPECRSLSSLSPDSLFLFNFTPRASPFVLPFLSTPT